jgi:small subunit ribosomal protein S4e
MIPCLTTHDSRTVRNPDPVVKVHDVIKLDVETGKIISTIKFDVAPTSHRRQGP